MPEFHSRDPNSPAFWDERFEQQFTPWDRGGVPDALRDFVRRQARPLRTLIPGCGSAYELAFLSEAGWDATAIDFSPAAVAAARAAVGKWSDRVVEADFFNWQPGTSAEQGDKLKQEPGEQLDMIYERAFLCALPRSMWPQVAQRWAELLSPGALLAGFFFFDDAVKGPPFGISPERLDELLTPHFVCLEDEPVRDSIPVFAGKERWKVWQRR